MQNSFVSKFTIFYFSLLFSLCPIVVQANVIDSLQKQLKNIDSLNNPAAFIETKKELGRSYIDDNEDYPNAIILFTSALEMAQRFKMTQEAFKIEVELAEALAKQGKHELSVARLKKVVATIGENDLVTKAKAMRFLAMNKIYMGDYEEAYAYQMEALNLYVRLKDSTSILRVKIGIAKNLFDQRQYDKVIAYGMELLPVARQLKMNVNYLTIHLLIGESYLKKNQLFEAHKYIAEALRLSENYGDKSSVAWSLLDLGVVKTHMKLYSQAINHLEKAYLQAQEYSDLDLQTETLQALADVYLEEKQYEKALDFLQKSFLIARRENMKPVLVKIYKSIAEIYFNKNDIQQYKIYTEKYHALKDSTVDEKLSKSLSELKQNFEVERLEKENEVNILKKDNEIHRVKNFVIVAGIVAILIIAILAILLMYVNNKNQKEKNQILLEKNYEITKRNEILAANNRDLEQYAHIISHDLKEPLRNIGSFTNLLQRRLRDTEGADIREYINFIMAGVAQMNDLLNDLLLYSKVGNHKAEMSLLNPENILADVLKEKDKKIKEAQAHVDIRPMPMVYYDKHYLRQIFNVLLDNALKFRRDEPPRINVFCEDVDDYYKFSVKDNGIGIDEKYYENIFVIFKRVHDRSKYKGTSVGLATCKKILNETGGAIWVESTLNTGSTFHFQLPKKAA